VFLAGDAAHVHSPLGGRGMNLAMQDAVELAGRFISNDFEGYTESRHTQAVAIANFSERLRFCSPQRTGLCSLSEIQYYV